MSSLDELIVVEDKGGKVSVSVAAVLYGSRARPSSRPGAPRRGRVQLGVSRPTTQWRVLTLKGPRVSLTSIVTVAGT